MKCENCKNYKPKGRELQIFETDKVFDAYDQCFKAGLRPANRRIQCSRGNFK